jgi:NADH:ubiquinone oxidoreductase subunit 4 (subunit M)
MPSFILLSFMHSFCRGQIPSVPVHRWLPWVIEYKHPAVEAVLRAHISHISRLEEEAEAAGK